MDFLSDQIKKRKKIVRYLFSGGTAAIVNFGLLYFLTDTLGFWYLFSSIVSFAASFLISFFLQKFWTFGDSQWTALGKQMAIFLMIALINLVANTVLMYLLVDFLKIWYMLSQFFISSLIAGWSFVVYKFFVFKPSISLTNGE